MNLPSHRLHHHNHLRDIPCELRPDGTLAPLPEWRLKGFAAAPYGHSHAIVFERCDASCDDVMWFHGDPYRVKDRLHLAR